METRIIPLKVVGKDIMPQGDTSSARGSLAVPVFRIYFDDQWGDLLEMSKVAKFTDARGDGGETVEVELLTQNADGSFDAPVPLKAQLYDGMAELTIIGEHSETQNDSTVVTKRITTRPYRFRVYESSYDRTATNTEPITATDKQQIMQKVNVAEAYAKGTIDGTQVAEGQTGYHDNAKYYAEEIAAGYASDASDSAEDAADSATLAESYAKGGTGTRTGEDNDNAKKYAENAAGSASNAYRSEENAADSEANAEMWANGSTSAQATSTNNAKYHAGTSEAYAKGTRGGSAVSSGDAGYNDNAKYYKDQARAWADGTGATSGDDQYHNNAKYWAETKAKGYAEAADGAAGTASEFAELSREYADGKTLNGDPVGEEDPGYHNNAKYYSEQAAAAANANIAEDFSTSTDYAVGDYCVYEGKLYRFTALHAEGAWTGLDVTDVLITEDLQTKYVKGDGGLTVTDLANDAVETAKIKDGNVTSAKIGSKEVKTANIDDGAVGNDQLAPAVKTTIAGKADTSTLAASGGAAMVGVVPPEGSSGVTNMQGVIDLLVEVGAEFITAYTRDGMTGTTVENYLHNIENTIDALSASSIAATAPSGYSGDTIQTLINALAAKIAALTASEIAATAPSGYLEDDVQGLIGELATAISAKYTKPQGGIPGTDIAGTTITGGADGNIAGLTIEAVNIKGRAITTPKIYDGAVTKAKLAEDALEAIYAAYPTDGATAATRHRTLLGADGIPLKTATVTQTSGSVPTTWVIRRTGKNLFDRANMVFDAGYTIENGIFVADATDEFAACRDYIPVVPGMRIFSQGLAKSRVNSFLRMGIYDANKNYLGYKTPPTKGGEFATTVTTAMNSAAFIRLCAYKSYVDGNGHIDHDVQIELVEDTPSAALSAWEAYKGEDTLVSVSALNTPTAPTTLPTTLLGQNVFALFPQDSLTDADPTQAIDLITQTATMDLTVRLDPTLVMHKLETAIAALGTT